MSQRTLRGAVLLVLLLAAGCGRGEKVTAPKDVPPPPSGPPSALTGPGVKGAPLGAPMPAK